ncbi:nuclear valosin containing protein [Trichuris trichiura]|uniref:Nuclear valosin containing protein n=1 Tax=Trichuris trichiura TaxID=36087 RepID=A0A077Z0H3_TRITR|nr:nuclear valosin containing protein [Trichuris trichiura]
MVIIVSLYWNNRITYSLKEICKLMFHMKHPEVYASLGVKPPRGFLLHGPPGCGKTLLAHAIAGEFKLPFIKLAATEIISGISGDSEKKIRRIFSKATENAPCILFIDEIDAVTQRRDSVQREMDRRIVSQLLSCIDELENSDNHVLFIGATNRPESLDPALRMAGRFDREIAFGMPDEKSRSKLAVHLPYQRDCILGLKKCLCRILQVLCRSLKLEKNFNFSHLSRQCPGFVGADLKALIREACICAIKRVFTCGMNTSMPFELAEPADDDIVVLSDKDAPACNGNLRKLETELDKLLYWLKSDLVCNQDSLNGLFVQMADFDTALKHVQPSAKREGFATVPDVTWSDVGALEHVREELQWSILVGVMQCSVESYPVRWSEQFSRMGLGSKAQGLLLCGPPGCGKTLIAKAIANESGINFISVKGPELLNMYVGESERAVRQVFQRAKNSSPCVIFFDEIDALCPRRSQADTGGSARLVNQLLTEMDGVESRRQVFVMAATNRPGEYRSSVIGFSFISLYIVDPAMLRPGRLDKILYVGLPNVNDRISILNAITKNKQIPLMGEDVDFAQIAADKRCTSFSGADLQALVREASVEALREFFAQQQENIASRTPAVLRKHFDIALCKVKSSISHKVLTRYFCVTYRKYHCLF